MFGTSELLSELLSVLQCCIFICTDSRAVGIIVNTSLLVGDWSYKASNAVFDLEAGIYDNSDST